jgi:polyferredoxin
LAVLGVLRRWDWLKRRAECGKPCQKCRHDCEYKAIRNDGSIQYAECFQCLDCVAIYGSEERCAPLLLQRKQRRVIRIHAQPAS